jgi:predicted flavoprotein YhiN
MRLTKLVVLGIAALLVAVAGGLALPKLGASADGIDIVTVSTFDAVANSVPEAVALTVFAVCLIGLAIAARRRQQRR